jgi:hypothetical protein
LTSVEELSAGTVLTGGASGDGADCPHVREIAVPERSKGRMSTRRPRTAMSP